MRTLKSSVLAYAALCVALACFLRFYRIEDRTAWHDELISLTRISGYKHYNQAVSNYLQLNPLPLRASEFKRLFQPDPERGFSEILRSGYEFPQVPLYYLASRLWAKNFGGGLASLRYFSACLGILSLFAIFSCGRILGRALNMPNYFAAILTSLAASSPSLVLLSQEARMYSMLLLTSAIALIAFCLTLQRTTRLRCALLLLVCVLGMATHLLFAIVLGAMALYVLAAPDGLAVSFRRKAGLWALVLLCPIIVLLSSLNNHFSVLSLPPGNTLPTAIAAFTSMFSFARFGEQSLLQLQDYTTQGEFNALAVCVFALLVIISCLPIATRRARTSLLFALWAPPLSFVVLDLLFGGQRSSVMRYYTISAFAAEILVAAGIVYLLSRVHLGKRGAYLQSLLGVAIWLSVTILGLTSILMSTKEMAYHKYGPDIDLVESIVRNLESGKDSTLLYLVPPLVVLPVITSLTEDVRIDSLAEAVNDQRFKKEYLRDICDKTTDVYVLRSLREPQNVLFSRFDLKEREVVVGKKVLLSELYCS